MTKSNNFKMFPALSVPQTLLSVDLPKKKKSLLHLSQHAGFKKEHSYVLGGIAGGPCSVTWEDAPEVKEASGALSSLKGQVAAEGNSLWPVGSPFWMYLFCLKCLDRIPNVAGIIEEMN